MMAQSQALNLRRPVAGWETTPVLARGEASAKCSRPRILIVDASVAGREETREALAELEAEIHEANGLTSALTAISSNGIDLVVITMNRGETGATDLCRILKRTPSTKFLPVFVLAQRSDVESEVQAIEAGVDGYYATPVRRQVFHANVRAILRKNAMIESHAGSETVLFSLAQSMEDRDPGLGQHCERLALMVSAMGTSLELPMEDIVALQRAGYLHDIGKVAVPDEILFKRGPLTPEEWKIMESHPERGVRICSSMRSLQPVLPIIKHHHERWDGSGYPDRLRGEEIPLLARILQLADIYDALTTARSYKPAFSPEQAIATIKEEAAKGWRDPRLVEQFSELLPQFRANASVTDLSQFSLQALSASVNQASLVQSSNLILGI